MMNESLAYVIITSSSAYDKSILVYSKIELAVTLLQKIAVE
jgi:hypothetical protein